MVWNVLWNSMLSQVVQHVGRQEIIRTEVVYLFFGNSKWGAPSRVVGKHSSHIGSFLCIIRQIQGQCTSWTIRHTFL